VDAPGCSYNPEPEAHHDVLRVAAGIELAKAGEQRRLRNVARPTPGAGWEEIEFVQYRAGEGELEVDGNRDPAEEESRGAGAEKKTPTQRNKESRREAAERERRAREEAKRLRAQLDRVEDISAELEMESAAAEAKARKKRDAVAAMQLPAKLGRHRYDPLPLQVQLSEEVTGSIRELKPTARLVEERFKSLQGRQMLEAGKRLHKPKSKSEYATSSKHKRHYARAK